MTPEAFQHALRAGHGSAVKHVLESGLDKVADLLLDACLNECSYDAQCEGGRALWLYQMFRDAPQRSAFAAKIIDALQTAHRQSRNDDEADPDWYTLNQLCHLTSLLARGGDDGAAQCLREFVLGQDFRGKDRFAGGNALVLLDGAVAARELARGFGRLLQEDEDAVIDSLDELLEDSTQSAGITAELEAAKASDQAIAAYMYKYRADNAVKPQRPAPPIIIAEQVIDAARSGSKQGRGYYFSAGRRASPAVAERIFECLIRETDGAVLERLLWFFTEAELPHLHQELFDLAETGASNLKWAATRALGRVADPRVGALGRKLIQADSFCADDDEVVYLFNRNLMLGDELTLMSGIQGLALDARQLHDFGFAIVKLLQSNHSEQLADLAGWLYAKTPCSICRHDCVAWLYALSLLTAERAEECRYDANPDTRRLARAALGVASDQISD